MTMKKRLIGVVFAVFILLVVVACGNTTSESTTTASGNVTVSSGDVTSSPGGGDTTAGVEQQSAADEGTATAIDAQTTTIGGLPAEKRKLTLSERAVRTSLKDAIDRFETLHPDVEVVITDYAGDYDKFERDTYTRLMAGTADDVIRAMGFSDMEMFDSGLLADFNLLMQNDPTFRESDYIMSVLKGAEYKGKLYTFPTNFTYSVFGVNSAYSEKLAEQYSQCETISRQQMIDMLRDLPGENAYQHLISSATADGLIQERLDTYIDYENKTCDFSNNGFVQFITEIKDAGIPLVYEELYVAESESDSAEAEDTALYPFEGAGVIPEYCTVFFPYTEQQPFSHYIPLVDEAGNILYGSEYAFCISEASENKDLAWEFVKFMVSSEGLGSSYLFPVQRSFYQSSVSAALTSSVENTRTVANMDGETDEIVEQVMTIFDKHHGMPMKWTQYPESVKNILLESMRNFYDGILTAEQTAAELQNKMSLYLMEMK